MLIGRRAALDAKQDIVEPLQLMLAGVVAGRRRRYVMMNATVEMLPAIRAVLPSMGAPTVLPLAVDGEIAVTPRSGRPDVAGAARAQGGGSQLDPRRPRRAVHRIRGIGLDEAVAAIAPIVADVRDRGDAALLEWTERFDGPRPDGLRVSTEAIERATVPTTSCGRCGG